MKKLKTGGNNAKKNKYYVIYVIFKHFKKNNDILLHEFVSPV
jgi:hypothetical protein